MTTAKLIDGKTHAATIRREIAKVAGEWASHYGRPVGLDVILVGDDPASQVYVASKERQAAAAGLRGHVHRLPRATTQESLEALIATLNADTCVDGILLQLPLPPHLDATRAVGCIAPAKDVDGLSAQNAGALALGLPGLFPCTPLGIIELLKREGVALAGARALVIGRSPLVGLPVARMLTHGDATVTLAHSKSRELAELALDADVLVVAAGKRHFVRGAWVKPGSVVIDVGIHRDASGTLAGDVVFDEVTSRAALVTPVPGGVGPMTIAMLLSNTVKAATVRALDPGIHAT